MNISYYIIIFDKELVGNQVFQDRINRLGDSFYLLDGNIVLLKSESTVREIYSSISAEEFSTKLMMVMQIDRTNYFGYMQSNLWGWLKEQPSNPQSNS